MPDNDNIKFKKFKETLPDNLKNTDEETYNLRGYWEALGKPEEFDYSQPKEADGYYHAFSRNPQTGEILKKENHPTFKMAIEGDMKAGYKAYRNKETGKIHTFKEEPDKNKYEIFKHTDMEEIEGLDFIYRERNGEKYKVYLIDGDPVEGVSSEEYHKRKNTSYQIEGVDYVTKIDSEGDEWRDPIINGRPASELGLTNEEYRAALKEKDEKAQAWKAKLDAAIQPPQDKNKSILDTFTREEDLVEGKDFRTDSITGERIYLIDGHELDSPEAEKLRKKQNEEYRKAFLEKRKKESGDNSIGLYGEEGVDWEWREVDGNIKRKVIGLPNDSIHWSEREFEKHKDDKVEGIDYINRVDDTGKSIQDKSYAEENRKAFNEKIKASKEKFTQKIEAEKKKRAAEKAKADRALYKKRVIESHRKRDEAREGRNKEGEQDDFERRIVKTNEQISVGEFDKDNKEQQIPNRRRDKKLERWKKTTFNRGEEITAEPSVRVQGNRPGEFSYETTITTPSGRKSVVESQKPLTIKKAFGDTYLTEEGTDVSYKINKADDNLSSKKVSDKDITKDKLQELIQKSKSNRGLTPADYDMAAKVYNLRQLELDSELKGKGGPVSMFEVEGALQFVYETENVRERNEIETDQHEIQNEYENEILLRKASAENFEQIKQSKEAYEANKQKVQTGEISVADFTKIENDYLAAQEKLKEDAEKIKNYEDYRDAHFDYLYNEQKYKADKKKFKDGLITEDEFEKLQDAYEDKRDQIESNPGFFGTDKYPGLPLDYSETNEDKTDFLNQYAKENKEVKKQIKNNVVTPIDKIINNAKSSGKGKGGKVTVQNLKTETTKEDEDINVNNLETQDDYKDKDYLQKQIDEIDSQLSDLENVEEFTPDLSMLDNNENRYGNLISMAGDLGAGIMGLKGAMEEVPIYEKGEMFNAYTDEAYRQRNMGLTGEEMGLRKQLAERGFGYDVKNIRRLAGGSAGVALGNLGRAASTLQTRYGQIAAEDSAVRRINQQRFDRAALSDENFNRRKFEDSFKVAMLNKEMGAQLVRDKMKNMHERQMFEKQYGKGSIYDELSREMLASKQENTHALKMAQKYQADKQKAWLEDRKNRLQKEYDS